jgi:predicted NUDIX family phosphoesterase
VPAGARPSDPELVLVVARELLLPAGSWRGVKPPPVDAELEAIRRHGLHRARGEVEDDPSWKQVIPYLVLRDGERLFLMRRTRAGADARLHDRFSIGVGGHLNPEDGALLGGLLREWREELVADFTPEFALVGLLNDDDDPVGAVHLGVVFEADGRGRPVTVRETDKLSGGFASLDQVRAVYDDLETWSQLLFDHLAAEAP